MQFGGGGRARATAEEAAAATATAAAVQRVSESGRERETMPTTTDLYVLPSFLHALSFGCYSYVALFLLNDRGWEGEDRQTAQRLRARKEK